MTDAVPPDFASTLIAWQREHGRQTLPWQQLGPERDAYRVWLAEIMLQQTQVAAVVPFYRRFVERFPDVASLASASLDDVMQHWSGLGYYSRARNLHAAARRVVDVFDGLFPSTVAELETLPGVGRSTAGAIAAFAFGTRAAILDGNVKRVLARVFAIGDPPLGSAFERRLWALTESLLPDGEIERYTQGLMDLGATICTPRRPACLLCPFEPSCIAHREGREEAYPQRVVRKPLPQRRTTLLLAVRGVDVLLERRPPIGIWGGLWSLPEIDGDAVPGFVTAHSAVVSTERLPGFVHGFTHYVLEANVLRVTIDDARPTVVEADAGRRWFGPADLASVGLPAPIRTLLSARGG